MIIEMNGHKYILKPTGIYTAYLIDCSKISKEEAIRCITTIERKDVPFG